MTHVTEHQHQNDLLHFEYSSTIISIYQISITTKLIGKKIGKKIYLVGLVLVYFFSLQRFSNLKLISWIFDCKFFFFNSSRGYMIWRHLEQNVYVRHVNGSMQP